MFLPNSINHQIHSNLPILFMVEKCHHIWLDQNSDPSLLTNKLWLFFDEEKAKKKKNSEKKKSKWPTQKKTTFFKITNSQFFFVKISWSGPWVSRIHWCEGLNTYMAVRLSDISSKTGQKCIFCVFWPFLSLCWTASRPYRLSHTNVLRINEFY